MTEVTLDFLARQFERVLDRLGAVEDQITVLTGITMRLEGQMAGLTVEIRGLASGLNRLEHRVRKLEDQT